MNLSQRYKVSTRRGVGLVSQDWIISFRLGLGNFPGKELRMVAGIVTSRDQPGSPLVSREP